MKNLFCEALSPYAGRFSGCCLISTGEGPLFSLCSGLANRDFGIPNRMDTKFDSASITKAFTAAAVLALADGGKLSLADPIADLVDLSGTAISPAVTLEHLLTHTSGIADDADEESGEDYAALFVEHPNYALRCCRDFLPNFAYKPPYFAPGTGVRYNNCAFILLGLAIEAVTGMDSRAYIEQAVFRPCGMKHTRFCAKDAVEENRAEGYSPVRDQTGAVTGWAKNIYSYPPVGTPDGGAYTTVGDLERFFRSLTGEKLLSPAATRALRQPHCPFPRENKYGTRLTGYAFEFILRGDDIFCMYKEGENAGAAGITAWFPARDLTVHLLSNQDDGLLWELYGRIKDICLEHSTL